MNKPHYIIIGCGAAGCSAALQIVKLDPEALVTIITREPYYFYHKFDLADYLSKKLTLNKLFDKKSKSLIQSQITLRLFQEVVSIDCETNSLMLIHNEQMNYDKLLIASGVVPYIPPAYHNLSKHFLTINSLEDVNQIHDNEVSLDKVLILGGGLTAIKIALSLKESGKDVEYVMFRKRTGHLLLEKDDTELLKNSLVNKDISYFEDLSITKIVKKKGTYTVSFSNKDKRTYSAIFAAFGVSANIDLAEKSNINCDQGILVNQYFETNYKNIYAAGDCAQIYNTKLHDYWVNFGWPNAIKQGIIAAKNMCGIKSAYNVNTVNIFDIKGIPIKFKNWE